MSEIKPALSSAQWKGEGYARYDMGHGIAIVDDGGATTVELPTNQSLSFVAEHRHAVAALALYGQPFGFTHEDVKALWVCVQEAKHQAYNEDAHRLCDVAASAIERIKALLPPEQP